MSGAAPDQNCTKKELMTTICVFAGSRPGATQCYAEAATDLGRVLATGGIDIVYGGGAQGLMGALADSALAHGGIVTGIIPEALVDRELGHTRLSELIVVPDMHTRKAMMAQRSDGFIALPGGFGTLEEIFEVITWAQLGLHHKPVVFLDVYDFYADLFGFLNQVVSNGFATDQEQGKIHHVRSAADAVAAVERHSVDSAYSAFER